MMNSQQSFQVAAKTTGTIGTTSSTPQAFGSTLNDRDFYITNKGTKIAYFEKGGPAVAATVAGGLAILPGYVGPFQRDAGDTHWAAICNTGDTTDLQVVVGSGT